MVGAKAGDRVLFIGRIDAALAGEVARITGLNGHTLVGCRAADRAAVETGAANAGALIDVVEIPATDRSPVPQGVTAVDVVIALTNLADMDLEARLEAATDAVKTLRPGGRLIVIDGQKRSLLGGRKPAMPADAVVPMLTSVGAQAARALGVEDGVTFYEARKSR